MARLPQIHFVNILSEQRRFYQKLYMSRNKNNEAIKFFLDKDNKDYNTMLRSKRIQFSHNSLVLERDFLLNEDPSRKVLLLPHIVF